MFVMSVYCVCVCVCVCVNTSRSTVACKIIVFRLEADN